jgi:hypothetical protein
VLRRLHGWAAVFWLCMAPPSMLWWNSSIPYLVGLSVYSVVTGHWSSWQSSRTEEKQGDAASWLRHLHGWATVVWAVLSAPSMLWWSNSIPYLVFLSVYAVVVGHWSSWQAARVEEREDERQSRSKDA